MQKLKAIVTIVRLPNTIFIVVAQLLCSFYLVLPFIQAENLQQFLSNTQHVLLAIATGFIAAGGYLINDYFDLRIDSINKPKRVTVERNFRRRHIMLWHIALSAIGFLIALYCAIKSKHISLALIQLGSIGLLIAYSNKLKRIAIWGNVAIAFLAMLNVLTPSLYEHQYWHPSIMYEPQRQGHLSLASVAFVALFAFLITLLREIIKDVEDIKGDRADECKTLPIKFGIAVARYCCLTITAVLILYGIWYVYYVLTNSPSWHPDWLTYKACFAGLVITPLLALLYLLLRARTSKHFKRCSRLAKLITFAGILITILL
ncbi:MAG: hypothetical protein RL660_2178 [Bacteroidota bacterium]